MVNDRRTLQNHAETLMDTGERQVNDAKKKQKFPRGHHPNTKNNLKPFPKGISGNPSGSKPGFKQRGAIFQRILSTRVDAELPDGTIEKLPYYEVVALGQAKSAEAGNTAAWKEIQDSVHGKIPDRVEDEPAEKQQVAKLFALLLIALQDRSKSPVEQVASAVEGYCRLKGYDPAEIAGMVQAEATAMSQVQLIG